MMMKTPDNQGGTVWDHGVEVKNTTLQQIKLIKNYPANLPRWINLKADDILWFFRHNWKAIRTALKFHDCGKPFVANKDENGIWHFPNHWDISWQKFEEYSGLPFSKEEYDLKKLKSYYIWNKLKETIPVENLEKELKKQKRKCLASFFIRNDFEPHIIKTDLDSVKQFFNKPNPFDWLYYPCKIQWIQLFICYCEIISNYRNDAKTLEKRLKRIETIANIALENNL